MNGIMLTLLFILATACMNEEKQHKAREIRVVDFAGLEPYLQKDNDTTYVINFWATWCKPCVEEMPAFIKLDRLYRDKKFKLILVSLDFPSKLEDQVKPYVKKNKIRAEVVLLNDPDANSWINKVDPDWSGAIPVTLIYNSKSREFYERTFSFEELKKIVESKLHMK
ncbi:MAG: TlpA disulfide reductase family protein [Bacteroidota bacterium]|nr:TlpA disulfide reductase family protein [Bacteroidota bacterium]